MSSLDNFRVQINQILSDTKVQIVSIQNDLEIVPETIRQLTSNAQFLLDEALIKIEALSKQLMNDKVINDQNRSQINKAVAELQKMVNNTYSFIKGAINKAK